MDVTTHMPHFCLYSGMAFTSAAAEWLPKQYPLHPSTTPTQFRDNFQQRLHHGSHRPACLSTYGRIVIEGSRYMNGEGTMPWRDSDYSLTSDSKSSQPEHQADSNICKYSVVRAVPSAPNLPSAEISRRFGTAWPPHKGGVAQRAARALLQA